ncbi:MAG: DHH family phosphoesterase [Spirochaetes bacterium]|nr:DHH family phosphoesterase [Spirochaetota bacterium]
MEDPAFGRLVALLPRDRPVAVQTHDRPDIDAFAAAYSLSRLLQLDGFDAKWTWRGPIRSRSLANLIQYLQVPDIPWPGTPEASLVIVDGIPENGNVSLVPGKLVAAIDHHESSASSLAEFTDIRPTVGACCSIIAEYWKQAGRIPGKAIATALMAGIQSDTDFLSREAHDLDLESFASLSPLADRDAATGIVKIAIDSDDLSLISSALAWSVVEHDRFFAALPEPCRQEVPSVLADFALRASDVRIAIVAVVDEEGCRISVRSRDPALPAAAIVRATLEGIGSGGGHFRGAGGFIPAATFPGERRLMARFFAVIDSLELHVKGN